MSRPLRILLTLAPLVYLIVVVVKYSVDVPYADQWELVPVLEKSYQGTLTLSDLWAQHNEHRLFFPRTIMLALARMTRWNIGFELAVNIILAAGILALLVWLIKRTARAFQTDALCWAVPAGSLIVFSINQHQNWLWGWQLQMFLSLLAAVGGILLLANGEFNWIKFASAAVLGFVATHSFANGMLFWPIGLILLLRGESARKTKIVSCALWSLLTVLALGSYFLNYQKPPKHPSLGTALKYPIEYISYVLKYIGSPCAQFGNAAAVSDSALALVFGFIGLLILAWAVWSLIWKDRSREKTLLPWLALVAYSVLSALMTGIGRAGFGSDQAMESRYCTMAAPFWISLIVFLMLLGWPNASVAGNPRFARWFFWIFIGFLGLSSAVSIKQAQGTFAARVEGRDYLLQLAAHPEIKPEFGPLFKLYPSKYPFVVVERYPVLVNRKLSLFRR